MEKGRITLIALNLKYSGDWDKMYADILEKKNPEQEWLDKALLVSDAITLVDDNYPEPLKRCFKPPFVIFGCKTEK